MRNIDDHHRNPNINDRDHQVGQLTNPHPPYTMAALPTGKLSPSPGRHAGGYLVRFTRSSVMKLIKHSKLKRERYILEFYKFQRCAWNELTKFQECNVIHMSWKVLMNNNFADSDMFPAQKRQNTKNFKLKGLFNLSGSLSFLRSWRPRMTERELAGSSSGLNSSSF